MQRRTRLAAALIITTGLIASIGASSRLYGPKGHHLVGAIADQRLAGDPVAAKVRSLLDGLTLERAATLPDEIKAWDKTPPSDPDAFHLHGHAHLEAQLKAFWEANPPKPNTVAKPSHHAFHYTDVPCLTAGDKYADGAEGRNEHDIVHMITFCVQVLQGTEPANNPRKITKSVAVILLAHYVGDIHQPLHVGAEYFDTGGPVDPDKHQAGFADQGGGTITLVLDDAVDDHGHVSDVHTKLHSYWDDNAVTTARRLVAAEIEAGDPDRTGSVDDGEIAQWLGSHEPTGWKNGTTGDPTKFAEAWANEILPIAREAHERLEFSDIKITNGHPKMAKCVAEEKAGASVPYPEWAGGVVKNEIHKAGWRLAELLRRTVN